MDLRLTEQQEMTRNMARELAAKEIAPIANVVRGFSLVHAPEGSHYENLGGEDY